jgi:hypothetical protein
LSASFAGTPPVERQQRTDKDAQHSCAPVVIVGQHVAQPVRNAQHVLSHRHPWYDAIGKVRCHGGHAFAAATRTNSPALAAKRHPAFEVTTAALEAGKPMGKHTAGQVASQFFVNELRQSGAVANVVRCRQKRIEMRAKDLV